MNVQFCQLMLNLYEVIHAWSFSRHAVDMHSLCGYYRSLWPEISQGGSLSSSKFREQAKKTVKKTRQSFVGCWLALAKNIGCRKSSAPESYVELSLLAGDAASNVFSDVGNGVSEIVPNGLQVSFSILVPRYSWSNLL